MRAAEVPGSASCPACGRVLAPDAIEGLCAACLLAAGSETITAGSVDDLPTVSSANGAGPSSGMDGPRLDDGRVWGGYRIGRLLGRGGMGEVYEAEHLDSGRRVALKVLRSRLQSPEERARFLREGQLAASVSHPHTVYIYGSDVVAGMPVISMELLPGGTLKDRVATEGPLSPGAAVSAVLDIVGGLDAAHAAGILHRDIKPSNCFIDRDGTVKVGDFGLSVSTLARDVHHELATTGFEGTPQFAAPEQLRGEPLDVRADIYAVGATLFYLLTGRPPFDAPDLRALFARVSSEPPPSPRALRPGVPAALAAVVVQCLAKPPGDRPASYAALADALRPFLPRADAPARPGIRFVAGVVDSAILAVPVTVWSMWAADPVTQTPERSALVSLWASLAAVVYYLVLEGAWRASPGKRAFRLRVAAADGSIPSFARVTARTLIYFGLMNLPTALLLATDALSIVTTSNVRAALGLAMTAVLFATIRRRNAWAAVHDLWTGTRVVERPALQARPGVTPAAAFETAAVAAHDPGRRCGPFTVVADAGAVGAGRLLVGFDPVLRRQVWMHGVAPDVPPPSAARRDVSRVGRLHWLSGRRTASEHWDAYESPDGGPLALVPGAVTWRMLKRWLLDLAQELRAAEADGSLPILDLDRLWLRQDGRLVLLDFPVPGPGPGTGGHQARAAGLTPVGLLAAVGASGMRAMSERGRPPAMPLSARARIEGWSAPVPPPLERVHADLFAAAAAPDDVTRLRRSIPIALAAAPAIVITVAAALMLPYMQRFMSNPQTVEILSGLSALQNANPPPASRLRDPEVRRAMERYLVGRHGAVLADDAFWETIMMQGALQRLRPVADDLLARHRDFSAEDVDRAATAIAREREQWARQSRVQLRGLLNVGGIIVSAMTGLAIAVVAVLGLLSAVMVPGGVMTRALGHAVVDRHGREIGRARSLARAAVAWMPALVWLAWLAASPKVQGYVPSPSAPWTGVVVALGLLMAGAILTIVRTRGPHDRMMGTWMVAQ